ncbi:MAG: Rieske (2Fe-2S) protein [Elusimicrobia bacterium]|nr:Rieske (2Fe-2S) protein [Elusimicrobiota bacterium]MDE2236383.1 Rieske (2Fe-2S) protein [Elusimicrobiota bacterium]MDE2425998.1 Rieske (2Fe-2S) protein [Elusimicrobiota bacterium]
MTTGLGRCPCESEAEEQGVTRRGFLAGAAALLAGTIASVLGAAGLSYFVSPAFEKEDENWIDVGRASELRTGAPVKVDYVARKRDAWVVTEKRSSVWLSNLGGGRFIAFDPRCTHLGCPYRWDQGKQEFLCPCHAGVFDREGKVLSGPPPRPLDRFPVKVVSGRLLIRPVDEKGAA